MVQNVQSVFVPRSELLSENEAHHILWSNISGSLASKMNNFVRNKSQATEDEKEGHWTNSKSSVNIQGLKQQNKEKDAFLSFIPSRQYV